MYIDHDTIVAPATAVGGALSLVRLSGSRAIAIADSLFHGKKPLAACESHTAHFGSIYKGEKLIDEVVATLFRAPKSYTGDDTVELTCHGSAYIVGEVLRLAIGAGARMAEPGEFTRRAYLSGRLNLSEAEAVADLIASSSEAAHRLATQQMRGGYTTAIEHLRDELLQLTTLLELELDFSEEDVEFADRGRLAATMEAIGAEIEALRGSFALGNAIKEGVPVAIVGAPNVGKSTLLNQLVKEERAMVSDIAGTTRDVIEEQIVIDGVRFRILDTAGIRATEDRLEKMGIERTLRTIERARIVIRMIDAAEVAQKGIEPTTFTLREDQHLITLINKCDTVTALPTLPEGVIRLTARTGEGVESLQQALHRAVGLEALEEGTTIVSTARHYEALTTASEALKRALEGLQADLPTDLLSEDIRAVIIAIGSITARGEILPSEILNNLFGHFCIGK
ncbi:MAG: tRNA uridine-5-carboxymethylaminomethyl(34) synthesis GTPase MnmE [Rikenellaceae bacterium]|nr:tRNA uridine-5-carboxymethylaminomethyl(34) synthesis GTPase MnmE [Rikenellaceae bacterium]